MKIKLTLISIAACSAALLANTGGVPKIEDRVNDLEQLALIQAQEIQSLKAKIEDMKPSPFTELEAARLKYLSAAFAAMPQHEPPIGGLDGWVLWFEPQSSNGKWWTLYLHE